MVNFELTYEPILLSKKEFKKESSLLAGAVVTFEGVTRLYNDGQEVTHLEYEAYHEFALKIGSQIIEDIIKKHNLTMAYAIHRLGHVPLGETALLVVTASPHRVAAFKACQEIIDLIKIDLPVWKKEFYKQDDGGSKWI